MKLPELDFDADAPDAYTALAALLTLHIGSEMTYAREPSLLWAVASIYVFGAAIGLLFVAVTDIDVREHGRAIATVAFLAVVSGVGVTYLMIYGSPVKTDALGFIAQAGDRLLAGKSPYTSALTAIDYPPTPLMDGGHVQTYSYPLGSALVAAPLGAIVPNGARLAVLLATVACGGLLLAVAPNHLAPLALSSVFVGGFITWPVNGLTDPLWVAPLLGALVLWPWSDVGPSSLSWSGVLYGVAVAMKQQPWFCAPFLFVWVWRDRDLRTAVRYAAVVAGVFAVINAPAFAMSPVATMEGMLVPVLGDGGSLVFLGVGASALVLGGYAVPKSLFTLLVVGVSFGSLAAYWRYFETLRWGAWLAWLPVLFMNYRSLMTYFVVAAPVAAMILICRTDWQGREVTASA